MRYGQTDEVLTESCMYRLTDKKADWQMNLKREKNGHKTVSTNRRIDRQKHTRQADEG